MTEQNIKSHSSKEIDLLQLAAKVLADWKFILKVTICFMVFGFVLALFSVKKYTAQVVMSPESTAYGMDGGMASLASLAGFNIEPEGNAIYPLLYPDIIQSLPFLCSLLDVHVQSVDGIVDTTYVHYVKKMRKKSWVNKVVNYPKETINKFFALFEKKEAIGNPNVFDPYRLSKSQMAIIGILQDAINVSVDKKTEVITLSFTDHDPLIAARMVDAMKIHLQERITEYRTKKAMIDCDYIEKLCVEAKFEYEQAQEAYAMYVDRNRNVTQERFLVEKERLAADRDLKNSLYMQWAQQLQLSKAKVQEQTPAFTTLKPASVPALPSSMSRLKFLILFTFLGAALSVSYLLLKDYAMGFFNNLFGHKRIVEKS